MEHLKIEQQFHLHAIETEISNMSAEQLRPLVAKLTSLICGFQNTAANLFKAEQTQISKPAATTTGQVAWRRNSETGTAYPVFRSSPDGAWQHCSKANIPAPPDDYQGTSGFTKYQALLKAGYKAITDKIV